MIDIKHKGSIPTGINSKKHLIYEPNQKDDFPISRSKFEDFRKCPKCFYLNLVKGFMSPDCPQMTLNSLTDTLLKKEFDLCRKKGVPHRLLKKRKLNHIIPYKNYNLAKDVYGKLIIHTKTKEPYKVIDAWRQNFHGIRRRFKKTNIILYGAVDDIWIDTKTKELIVADYKSSAKKEELTQETYFDDKYKESYKVQLDFYAYLLKGQKEINDIDNDISKDAYFYTVNARGREKSFDSQILFDEKLIHYTINNDYLEDEIEKMIDTINSSKIPKSNERCINCAYARQRLRTDTL